MNRLSAVLPTSFMVSAAAQLRDSEPVPKHVGAVPLEATKPLKWLAHSGRVAHAPAHLPPVCGTVRVPLPGPRLPPQVEVRGYFRLQP